MNQKIELPVSELKSVLTGLGKIIRKGPTLPVLGCVRVQRNNKGEVTLAGTDLDTMATARIETDQKGEPVELIVPHDTLAKIVKGCSPVHLIGLESSSKSDVTIHCPVGNAFVEQKVESHSIGEFPEIPSVEGAETVINDKIRSSLMQAMECSSEDGSRYVLNGAYLDVSKKRGHYVVGTDGRHLYSANTFKFDLKDSLIIRNHKFLEWTGFMQDGDWKLSVAAKEQSAAEWIQIRSNRWTFITKSVDGIYPNWRQVVPPLADMKTKIQFSEDAAQLILDALPTMPGTADTNQPIRLVCGRNSLTIQSRSKHNPWTKWEIPHVTVSGNPITIGLNRMYLAKALKFGFREVHLGDERSPLIFLAQGRQMVAMPVSFDDDKTPEKKPAEVPVSTTEPPVTTGPTEESKDSPAPPAPTTTTTESKPINDDSQPESQPTVADSKPEKETTMTTPTEKKSDDTAFETAITVVEETISKLEALVSFLKKSNKEQKTAEKDLDQARKALKTIQKVQL